MSTCSKPGCGRSATSILGYDYAGRVATLEDPGTGPISPHVYALCSQCAEKLQPPRGWTLQDERSKPPLFLDDARPNISVSSERDVSLAEQATESRQLFFGESA